MIPKDSLHSKWLWSISSQCQSTNTAMFSNTTTMNREHTPFSWPTATSIIITEPSRKGKTISLYSHRILHSNRNLLGNKSSPSCLCQKRSFTKATSWWTTTWSNLLSNSRSTPSLSTTTRGWAREISLQLPLTMTWLKRIQRLALVWRNRVSIKEPGHSWKGSLPRSNTKLLNLINKTHNSSIKEGWSHQTHL